jgi:hypothetical protein
MPLPATNSKKVTNKMAPDWDKRTLYEITAKERRRKKRCGEGLETGQG